jgi:hypothetical protein
MLAIASLILSMKQGVDYLANPRLRPQTCRLQKCAKNSRAIRTQPDILDDLLSLHDASGDA